MASGQNSLQKFGLLLLLALLLASRNGYLRAIGVAKVALGDAWFVIVEESDARTGSLANIISDAGLWDQAKTLGVKHVVYDDDLEQAAPYLPIASKAGVPAFLFINDGKVLHSGKMPGDRDAVLRILNQEW